MRGISIVLIGIVIASSCGCRPAGSDAPPSTATKVIEGATGKTALDAGRRAQQKIEEVSARHNAEQ